MREKGEDFGEQDEDTEIQKLPLYTERKADGIYRYRRRVPKNLVERIGKGYLYRNLGRTWKRLGVSELHSRCVRLVQFFSYQ